MSTHYDDEAQVEELRKWWKENWLALAGGLAVGLLAIFGWETYQRHQDARAGEAAQVFEDMRRAVESNRYADALPMADKLQNDFANTPYAAAGALKLAQAAVDANKLDDASTRLQWAAAHADDEGLKSLARLRLARVKWQQGRLDEALKSLDGLDPAYAALAAELRGDIKLAQNDRAAAHAAYEEALAKLPADNLAARPNLQRKLDDLADVAAVKS